MSPGEPSPNVELTYEEDTYKPGSAGGALTWPVNPRLRHPEPRQVWMAEQGIDVQINGGWLDSFGYVLPPYKGHAWSRFLKEHLIAASNEKDNLRALGSITLQDGEKAALLLGGLVGEGLAGVMIGTQLHGDHSNLDDPALNPFWAVASDHKAVVFIHPLYGCNDIRLNDYDIIKAVGQG